MSWSDDTRCLYCDGRLPLYRKLTNGQFCSAAHGKAYWQEQERLAVERLHQTHSTLRAYGPAAALGQPEPPQPHTAPMQLARPEAASPHVAGLGDVKALDSGVDLERPWWMPLVNTDQVPSPGFLHKFTPPTPQWNWNSAATSEPEPLEWVTAQSLSLPSSGFATDWPGEIAPAPVAVETMPIAGPVPLVAGNFKPGTWEPIAKGDIVPAASNMVPLVDLALDAAPQTEELQPAPEPAGEQVPFSEKLFTLPRIGIRDSGIARVAAPLPAAIAPSPQIPTGLQTMAAPAGPAPASLCRLPLGGAPLVHGIWSDNLRALDLQAEFGVPQLTLTMPALCPRLKLAPGTRYAMETRGGSAVPGGIEPADFSGTAPEVVLPPPAEAASEAAGPKPAGLVPLACTAEASQPSPDMTPAARVFAIPQPPATEPLNPVSRLEPMDDKPASDYLAGSELRRRFLPHLDVHAPDAARMWQQAAGFWKHAPRDFKVLVFAIPVLLGLALHPSLPKVRVSAPAAAGGFQRNLQRGLSERWMNVRQSMLDRAAIALDEDFRSGLDEWATRGDLDASWSFDASGFVRPGPLALYRPSLSLTDYQMQFLGVIDKKALSWVARAEDFDDYYVIKLVVLKPGPVPTIGMTRYAVIGGKAQDRSDAIVPITARNDMLYRVNLDIRGDDFSLAVQGQMVDSWSEPRLKRGGIGFFAARGEESRVRWVQVTHQYDMLGRLCAYLAPYNIPTTNGSW